MKRARKNLKYSPARRRMQLDETRYWPVVRAALVLLVCALFALAAVVLIPRWINRPAPAEAEGGAPMRTPAARPAEAAVTPGIPVSEALQSAVPETLRLFGTAGADALVDPFVYETTILFAAGTDAAHPTKLVRVDPVTGGSEAVAATCAHDAIRIPCEDAAYVVFFDAKAGGGGTVRALDKATGETRAVCEIASGVPALSLAAPYLLVRERISAAATRLVAWDLATEKSAALAVFTDPAYAASAPFMQGGTAYFADADVNGGGTGAVRTVRLSDGEETALACGTFVHDPRANDDMVAWLSGSHGTDSDLYWSLDGETACVARGVADYAVAPGCLVYGRDETIFAVAIADERTFVLSHAGSRAQLATAGGRLIVWRDWTDAGKPVWKYVRLG